MSEVTVTANTRGTEHLHALARVELAGRKAAHIYSHLIGTNEKSISLPEGSAKH
jgi:hypothetical protein